MRVFWAAAGVFGTLAKGFEREAPECPPGQKYPEHGVLLVVERAAGSGETPRAAAEAAGAMHLVHQEAQCFGVGCGGDLT